MRQVLMGNVVLSGGGSLFAGLNERLSNELSRNFPHVRPAVFLFLLPCCEMADLMSYAGKDPCARQSDGATLWRLAGRQHPCQPGHFPPAVD